MAIHEEELRQMGTGSAKKIEESAVSMILDNLQRYQYLFPIKSTVRELLSNGMDSIAEKVMAKQILTGKATMEDFFVEREGEIYKDSHFEKNYYDLNFLSDNDEVSMTYVENGPLNKDKVVFEDWGVGIGGKRLEGYFKLGYSTKRLSKMPIGKFGIGAKSPLSVGVDFYTFESRYNGKLFRFNIYSHTFDSIIPEMDMVTGDKNQFITFNTGHEDEYRVYWESTTLANGVKVTLEAKKHHKAQYIDAVKSQMLYFEGIRLVHQHDGQDEIIPYNAKILYEDDYIVMSDQNYYSKPHLLLNKVNYGYVAWEELELETRNGNVGIKVRPEDVEVNPSRESVIWSEKTKEKVLSRFQEVLEVAGGLIQKELNDTDIVKWIRTCYQISGRSWGSSGGIMQRLSNIVDLSKVKLKFSANQDLVFHDSEPLPGLMVKDVSLKIDSVNGRLKSRQIRRDEVGYLGNRLNKKIFLKTLDERFGNRKDKYLLTMYPEGFLAIQEPFDTEEQFLKDAAKIYSEEEMVTVAKKMKSYGLAVRRRFWDYLTESKEVLMYSKVEVPEGFTGNEDEVEEDPEPEVEETVETKAIQKVARLTAAERRKLEGKTVIHNLVASYGKSILKVKQDDGVILNYDQFYEFGKLEIPFRDINEWKAEEVYYGYDADSELMHFAAMLTRDPSSEPGTPVRAHAKDTAKWITMKWWRLNVDRVRSYGIPNYKAYRMQHFFDTNVMIFKVSQSNARYFRDFSRIQEFFFTIKHNTITMSNTLLQWNTARVVMQRLAECPFLYNFESFNQEHADLYAHLCRYVDKHYRDVVTYNNNNTYGLKGSAYDDLINHLDTVKKFQDFVATGPDLPEIARVAAELFGNRELKDGMAVDPQIIAALDKVLEFSTAVGSMLNQMPLLTGYMMWIPPSTYSPDAGRKKNDIPEDLESEIRQYLDSKGLLKYPTALEVGNEQAPVLYLVDPALGASVPVEVNSDEDNG